MPAPLAAAAAIQAGGQAFQGLTAMAQQRKANAYNTRQWHRQNEYNSPQEQMKRFQDAGLNPNLIYGSGNAAAGQASAAPEFEKLSDSAYQAADSAPVHAAFQAFTDWEQKKAQTDLLKQQATTQQQEQHLKSAQIVSEILKGDTSKFDLNLKSDLRSISYDAAKAQLQKIKADTNFTTNQDRRADVTLSRNVAESVERVFNSRMGRKLTDAQIKNLKFDSRVKQLDSQLAEGGLRPSDPFYARVIYQIVESLRNNPIPKGQKKQLDQKFFPNN